MEEELVIDSNDEQSPNEESKDVNPVFENRWFLGIG